MMSQSGVVARGRRLVATVCLLGVGLACLVASRAPAAQRSTLGAARLDIGQSGAGGGQAGGGSPEPSPLVSATLEQCLTAVDAIDRSATFNGEMQTVAGASRMAMEIVVQEHAPGEVGFHTLSAPGLDVWQRSETGVKIYKDVRQVTDLPAPAAFRATVSFRWLNEKGHVIKSTARRTPICRQSAPPKPAATPTPPPAPAPAPTSPSE
jgi:hypothetical protein